MSKSVKKAIIPAAGLGTRFTGATGITGPTGPTEQVTYGKKVTKGPLPFFYSRTQKNVPTSHKNECIFI